MEHGADKIRINPGNIGVKKHPQSRRNGKEISCTDSCWCKQWITRKTISQKIQWSDSTRTGRKCIR